MSYVALIFMHVQICVLERVRATLAPIVYATMDLEGDLVSLSVTNLAATVTPMILRISAATAMIMQSCILETVLLLVFVLQAIQVTPTIASQPQPMTVIRHAQPAMERQSTTA